MCRYTVPTLFLIIGMTLIGCDSAPPAVEVDAPSGEVSLEFNLDGQTTLIKVPDVADGATLESVMRAVDSVAIELSGSGSTAFVQSIGEIEMDASQGWTFKVDGEFANQGIGQTILHPPTTVQWSFGEFEL